MPSFFNGIFGHKPSTGIVPNGPGQRPVAHGEIDKFLGNVQRKKFQIKLIVNHYTTKLVNENLYFLSFCF